MKIESLQNQTIKDVVKLRDRKEREQTQLFLIEGFRELKRAVDAKRKIITCFYCPELFLGTNEKELLKQSRANLIECSKAVFEKISYRDRPDGLLGIAPQFHLTLNEIKLSSTPFLLIAEAIEKPGNLGTILRSSDAAGVDGVIVCDPTTDIHNPNVVRSSVGTLFTVPVVNSSTDEVLHFLKQHNILTVAATPSAQIEFTEADFKVPLAIVVGTEQYGLSERWMRGSDIQVKIPMLGIADSLNVASATTLLLYEVLRQRRHDK
jgi:TrmH family RNA methyltransferase